MSKPARKPHLTRRPYLVKPATIPVRLASVITGLGDQKTYRLVHEGSLPRADLGGQLLVAVAGIERAVGREFALAEINEALAALNAADEGKRARKRQRASAAS